MEPQVVELVKACGGISKAVHSTVATSRALWRTLLHMEHPMQGQRRDPYRHVPYARLNEEYKQISNDSSGTTSLERVVDRMGSLHLCWKDSGNITYRRSVLNPISLCRQLLNEARPDHDLRYLVWRDVRRYYNFVQSAEVAHYVHALTGALNDLIASRRQTIALQSGTHTAGISLSIHDEILPHLQRRMGQNFAIPLRMLEFFLECCRLVNYIQVSDTIGQLDIRAQEIDAEYLLSQLFGIPTGIKGLDELFGGGGLMLVESDADLLKPQLGGRAVLTIGPLGTGKSVLSLQMAVEVARKGGIAWVMPMEQTAEECLYSLETMGCLPDDVPLRIADSVPRAIELLETPDEDKGALILLRTIKERFDDFATAFEENSRLLHGYSLRLIIVDPISGIPEQDSEGNRRAKMLRLFEAVKSAGTNIWLVSEESKNSAPVEQNIADTVIHVCHETVHGYSQRFIEITKSRLQREQRGLHAYAIGPGRGITVYPSPAAVRSKLLKRTIRMPDTPIAFGLPSIDAILGNKSLYAGDVVVLYGQRGTGKTSVALAFALSADLPRSGKSSDTAMLVTNVEREVSVRRQLDDIYETSRRFARDPNHVRILGLPSGYVKPGYILQRIEDEFEKLSEPRRDSIARVVVDNISTLELSCPFVSADHTFGDTLVDLLRKHRVTALFVCRDPIGIKESSLQQSVLNNADCMIRFCAVDIKGTPEAHVEVRKTRGMHHRRGIFRLDVNAVQAEDLSA